MPAKGQRRNDEKKSKEHDAIETDLADQLPVIVRCRVQFRLIPSKASRKNEEQMRTHPVREMRLRIRSLTIFAAP